MGASAILLQACEDASTEGQVYRNLQGCIDLGDLTEAQCREVYRDALHAHAREAPRYTAREDCVAEFGAEQCQQQTTTSGGSFWMPLMMGYFAGSMLGSNRGAAEPLYRSRNDPGSFRTADNRKVPATFGKANLPKWATTPSRTRTQSVSRGGFGKRSTGWGG